MGVFNHYFIHSYQLVRMCISILTFTFTTGIANLCITPCNSIEWKYELEWNNWLTNYPYPRPFTHGRQTAGEEEGSAERMPISDLVESAYRNKTVVECTQEYECIQTACRLTETLLCSDH